ncbi:archaellin/type IV pilin N-terminal domain-containing protein [archaeon]
MRRGLSIIVSIVLMIAIAVVAAAGIYFWAGGLTTKQPTPQIPISITANLLDAATGTVAIVNLGNRDLTITYFNTTDGTSCDFGGEVTILPSQQRVCSVPPKRGATTLYSPETGWVEILVPASEVSDVTMQSGAESGEVTQSGRTEFEGGSQDRTRPTSIGLMNFRIVQHTPSVRPVYTWVNVAPDDSVYVSFGDSALREVYYMKMNATDGSNLTNPVLVTLTHPLMASDGGAHRMGVDPDGDLHFGLNVVGDEQIMYTKFDPDTGNNLTGIVMAVNSTPYDAAIRTLDVDSEGNVHIGWETTWPGDGYNAMYMKINGTDGSNLTNQIRLSPSGLLGSMWPQLGVDSDDNVHVTWVDLLADTLVYRKINGSDGSALIANTDISENANTSFWNFGVDSSDNVHLVWQGDSQIFPRFYYKKMRGSDAATLVDEVAITPTLTNDENLLSSGVDSDGNVHVFWYKSQTEVYYKKISGVDGSDLSDILLMTWDSDIQTGLPRSLAFGTDGSVHVTWAGTKDAGVTETVVYTNDGLYQTSGSFESEWFNATSSGNWSGASWSETLNGGTISVEASTGSAYDSLGAWELVVNNTIQSPNQYMKYRVNMTGDGFSTPVVSSISIFYEISNDGVRYTLNSETGLSWAALYENCSGNITMVVNNTGLGGNFFSATYDDYNPACSYYLDAPGVNTGDVTEGALPNCGVTSRVCGDSSVDDGEQCDDGNTESEDCCDSTCHSEEDLGNTTCGVGECESEIVECVNGVAQPCTPFAAPEDPEVSCHNGDDDDCDGDTDCDDTDCQIGNEIVGVDCGDDIDNDCDGLTDCNDDDCTADPICIMDDCTTAVAASDGANAFVTTSATTDGDPDPLCDVFGSDQIYDDVWFNYITTCTGTLTADTCGSGFDTRMALYEGCDCGTMVIVDCNDDSCGVQSEVTAAVTIGNCYKLRIGGFAEGLGGTGTLTVGCA